MLSYCIVFLVWLNHHDIFAGVNEVNARLLFINGGLLFCVSLIPFATAFAGETHWASPLAVALYGAVMVAVSLMFVRLRLAAALQAKDEAAAAHHRREAALSTRLAVLFVAGTALGWFYPRMALVVFAATPLVMRLRRKPGASADGTRD